MPKHGIWGVPLHLRARSVSCMGVAQDARVTAGGGLEQLYRDEGARLWRALVAFSGDREVASDAVSEAFAQAIGRESQLRDPQRWIWRAAFRIAAGELKARRRFGPPVVDPSYEIEEPPARLVAALALLSPNQRAALVLHYYAGYPTKDIAGVIGSSPATVRVHLSQGRKRLRRILEDRDD
jgi:RNA polymerase sigma-70 factor, ECF subfamily